MPQPSWTKCERTSLFSGQEVKEVVSRSAGDDDKVCIEFKSDELAINEVSARSMTWCFEGVTGSVCPCTD